MASMEHYDWDDGHFADLEYSLGKYGHLPTPPHSHDGESPVADSTEDENALLSVSTTFFPTAQHAQHRSQPPDIVLLSQDSVYFYVCSDLLLNKSGNGFRAMLPISPSSDDEPPILNVPEPSPVLNIILHAIYEMSCAHYSPPFNVLVKAVDSMPIYGIDPKTTILPATPLFTLLLSQAPLFPLDLYTLAAHYDIFELAVPTSSHLLAFPLSRLTDDAVERMGAIYLKRLFFLHFGRAEALKRVLGAPPHPHPPTPFCDFVQQKTLARAWALATAYLAWDIRPDMSTTTLESALRPLSTHLTCDSCKDALDERIKNLVVQWSIVKRTI
ncbi:hypothetical protein FB45DRAFT_903741 [Roridomyces roridus]|uniref:BTB domain-containing protein n=1 Tax=Roridomyces roridus TaxID=1738132 RepID=A0AAD7FUZ5_9AGAR|nr:hypothetical protein FB45DRAFT_903741 [Roridomyces roridus]